MHTLETSHENVYRISNQIEFDLLLKRVIGLVHLMRKGDSVLNLERSRFLEQLNLSGLDSFDSFQKF